VAGARDFSLLQNVQANSKTHLASYSMGKETSLPKGKVARALGWPFSAEIKNESSYTSIRPICLHGMDGDNFTFSAKKWHKNMNS
jgi:hypothetical protein